MYNSYQDYIDSDKVTEIANSIQNNGWQGSPIVVWGDTLITGNHRYAACKELGIDPETITLEEVFTEDGVDFDEAHDECGRPTADESLSELFYYLSDETIEKYGIQF